MKQQSGTYGHKKSDVVLVFVVMVQKATHTHTHTHNPSLPPSLSLSQKRLRRTIDITEIGTRKIGIFLTCGTGRGLDLSGCLEWSRAGGFGGTAVERVSKFDYLDYYYVLFFSSYFLGGFCFWFGLMVWWG